MTEVCTKTFGQLRYGDVGRACDCGHAVPMHTENGCGHCQIVGLMAMFVEEFNLATSRYGSPAEQPGRLDAISRSPHT